MKRSVEYSLVKKLLELSLLFDHKKQIRKDKKIKNSFQFAESEKFLQVSGVACQLFCAEYKGLNAKSPTLSHSQSKCPKIGLKSPFF